MDYRKSGAAALTAEKEAQLLADTRTNARQALQILFLDIASSVTPQGVDDAVAEVFSDASGNLNLIDTGNTTSVFETNKYTGGNANALHGVTMGATSAETISHGFKITVGASNKTLISITKHASTTSTQAHLCNASTTIIDTATFIGNTATFGTPQTLTAGTSYYILTKAEVHTIQKASSGVTYPITGIGFDFVAGYNGGDISSAIYALTGITVQGTNGVIQSTLLKTTSDNISGVIVINDGDTAGVTVSVSANNGTDYTTGNLNEIITPSVTGTQLKIKLHQTAGLANDSYGFGVGLWTV